ncbi:hypothetical protein ACRS7F_22865 [Brucella anthropi]|uniref:hypothetical protein n=1 Tax=Brucella anthropi TaxID=529 RepID=UPI001ADF327F|nr:hypothetical protein GTN27_15655 [Ochrobactrum sp. EEELCW01]
MRPFKAIWEYLTAILLGLAGAVTLVVCLAIAQMFFRDGFCTPEDLNGTACFRQWIAALSGWLGAFAAAATIFILYIQVKEQRKQTEFALGDSLPTIDAVQHINNDRIAVIRIVNWNRRSMIIEQLEPPFLPGHRFSYSEIKINGLPKAIIDSSNWTPVAIEGWINKNASPHIIEVQLTRYGFTDDRVFVDLPWDDVPKVFMTAKLLGEKHRRIRLSADVNEALD